MNQKTRKKLQERIAQGLMYMIDPAIKEPWKVAMGHADIAIDVMEEHTPVETFAKSIKHPKEIIAWANREIVEYRKLIKLLEKK
jgi:hypothetical protein